MSDYKPKNGDRVRVVIEGSVIENRHDGIETGGSWLQRAEVVSVEKLPDPEPTWQWDDHVLDAVGEVWRRTSDDEWWFAGGTSERMSDNVPPRPLTLLVRDGKPVSS